MTISYPGGFQLAAVLLDASGSIIRVAIDGWEDAAQFRLVNGQWLSESGEPVEIDSRLDTRPELWAQSWDCADSNCKPHLHQAPNETKRLVYQAFGLQMDRRAPS